MRTAWIHGHEGMWGYCSVQRPRAHSLVQLWRIFLEDVLALIMCASVCAIADFRSHKVSGNVFSMQQPRTPGHVAECMADARYAHRPCGRKMLEGENMDVISYA